MSRLFETIKGRHRLIADSKTKHYVHKYYIKDVKILLEAIEILEKGVDCGCIFHTGNAEGCPAKETMDKVFKLSQENEE